MAKERVGSADVIAEYVGATEVIGEYVGDVFVWRKVGGPLVVTLSGVGVGWITGGNLERRYRTRFSASVSGDTPPYGYAPAQNFGSGWQYGGRDRTGGTVSLTVTVTDGGAGADAQSVSRTASVTYPRDPTLPTPLNFSLSGRFDVWLTSPTPGVGRRARIIFSGSGSGGTPPLSYAPARNLGLQWAEFGASRFGGTQSLTVTVTDGGAGADAQSVSRTASVTYPRDPTLPTPLNFSLSGVGVGWITGGNLERRYRTRFSASVSGGTPPYRYAPAQNFGSGWQYGGRDRTGGTVSLTVTVTDSGAGADAQSVSRTASVTYPRDPTFS